LPERLSIKKKYGVVLRYQEVPQEGGWIMRIEKASEAIPAISVSKTC